MHARLVAHSAATKLDLAALIAWKHVRNAEWMRDVLRLPDARVREITSAAFAPALTDGERIDALSALKGFRAGGAFTSVLLTAWDPSEFGVFDDRVLTRHLQVVASTCVCDWSNLPVYWEHLRRIAGEMPGGQQVWTPRMVEMAIFNL